MYSEAMKVLLMLLLLLLLLQRRQWGHSLEIDEGGGFL